MSGDKAMQAAMAQWTPEQRAYYQYQQDMKHYESQKRSFEQVQSERKQYTVAREKLLKDPVVQNQIKTLQPFNKAHMPLAAAFSPAMRDMQTVQAYLDKNPDDFKGASLEAFIEKRLGMRNPDLIKGYERFNKAPDRPELPAFLRPQKQAQQKPPAEPKQERPARSASGGFFGGSARGAYLSGSANSGRSTLLGY